MKQELEVNGLVSAARGRMGKASFSYFFLHIFNCFHKFTGLFSLNFTPERNLSGSGTSTSSIYKCLSIFKCKFKTKTQHFLLKLHLRLVYVMSRTSRVRVPWWYCDDRNGFWTNRHLPWDASGTNRIYVPYV